MHPMTFCDFCRHTCTHLEGITLFLHAGHTEVDLTLLSDNLISIDLRLPISNGYGTSVGRFATKQFHRLQYLNLYGVQITDELCNSLLYSRNLCYLVLYHCAFQSDVASTFATLIQQLRQISKLALAYCWFSSTGQLQEILNNITEDCCNLESFDFRFPYVPAGDNRQEEIACPDFDRFFKLRVQMDLLVRMNLAGISGMSSAGFDMFLQRHSNLQTLELSSCSEVDDSFLYSIATYLSNLKSFKLRWCDNVTNLGIKFLAYHHNLRIFDFGVQQCNREGCVVDCVYIG